MAKVLVIEKDDGVREFMTRVLINACHHARAEPSFLSAAVNAGNDEFDLVILNASGGGFEDQRQLAREAKAIWHSHVLITSGGSAARSTVVEYDSFVFLAKPFASGDLLTGVNAALSV